MFDHAEPLDTPLLRGWTNALAEAALADEAVAQVDEIRALEEVVCAAQARQARLTGALDAASRDGQGRDGRGVAEQVALARRESPHRGRRHLSLARIAHELPHAMEAFRRGLVTEWRITILARETACLTRADRIAVDRAIAADPDAFSALCERAVLAETRKLVARLDPAAVAKRRRRAETERCVTVRPAPDTMLYLTALLPMAEGVAAYAALSTEAGRLRAAGDPRGRGQLMADTLLAHLTGTQADTTGRPIIPVSVSVVMTDRALLAGAHDPAAITDHGPIPADLARQLVSRAVDAGTRLWVRRLYTDPKTHQLVAMDSHRRIFPTALASFLRHRDQWCRTPWCNAPIRHCDHVIGAAVGGPTTAASGQGLCESCNYAKETPGWQHRPRPSPGGHEVDITTPTGHHYRSTPPPALAARTPAFHQVAEGRWVLIG